MSSRGATPGLHHRTGTQGSFPQNLSLASRAKRTQSFNRDYVSWKNERTNKHERMIVDNLVVSKITKVFSIGSICHTSLFNCAEICHRV